MSFMNQESRAIAKTWMRSQRIQIRFDEAHQSYVFMRPFDPSIGVLYIETGRIEDLHLELPNANHEPVPISCDVYRGPDIRRFANPAVLFGDYWMFKDLDKYNLVEEIVVAADMQPSWEHCDKNKF
ncbi:hypothetical protein BDV59DRAFT_188113 [Aspergillus ambiguus]|uniref:uncharacterized protein n=1 Tax=Aspergillus ambiguus TaxID=176160 RepID=UPI003CCE35C6